MKRACSFALLFFLLVVQASTQETPNSEQLSQFVDGNNKFALAYVRMLQARKPNDNLLIAPITSTLAFGALQNGASDAASLEISRTFDREGIALPRVNAAAHELLTQLKPGEYVRPNWDSTLKCSMSLWIRSPALFRPEWRKVATESYGATIQRLSSDVAENAKSMDAYLAKTLGKQLSIPAPVLTPREFALLIGSLFNGKWSMEFSENRTAPKEFKFRDHSKRMVEMMWQEREFPYLKGDNFQAVFLEYTGRYGMYVFLPDQEDGIDSFVNSMDRESWSKWVSSFERHRYGTLELPKFHVESSRDTTGDYKELGIREAFSNYWAMAGLATPLNSAKLTRVLEDASINVTEKRTVVITRGVVAGVIAGIAGGVPGPRPQPPFHMLVDHPFLFAIVDRPTKAILYMGVVTAPPITTRVVKGYRDPVEPKVPR